MTAMSTAQNLAAGDDWNAVVPVFVPHPWLWNGHLQTIVGRFLVGPKLDLPSCLHEIAVDGDDWVVVQESIPPGWREGDKSALLVRGAAGFVRWRAHGPGCGEHFMPAACGIVRMNLRGAGVGFGRAHERSVSRQENRGPPTRGRVDGGPGTQLTDRGGRFFAGR